MVVFLHLFTATVLHILLLAVEKGRLVLFLCLRHLIPLHSDSTYLIHQYYFTGSCMLLMLLKLIECIFMVCSDASTSWDWGFIYLFMFIMDYFILYHWKFKKKGHFVSKFIKKYFNFSLDYTHKKYVKYFV